MFNRFVEVFTFVEVVANFVFEKLVLLRYLIQSPIHVVGLWNTVERVRKDVVTR